jgi:hypothetical protein
MKKILFVAALLISSLTVKVADAQLRISLGLNIGSQPAWGPTGYDHAEYYYMPDIDTYYDVPNHQYVYLNGNNWSRSTSLPSRYGNYDLYNGYKVVVNERDPWQRAPVYRARYANFKGRRGQSVIRDSREQRYQNHWNGGNNGRGNNGRDNNGRPQGGNRPGGDRGHGNNGRPQGGNRPGGDRDHGNNGRPQGGNGPGGDRGHGNDRGDHGNH